MYLKTGERKPAVTSSMYIPHAPGKRMGTGEEVREQEARRLTAGLGQHALHFK